MNEIMLDLETLGNGPRPVIVAIGAVFFGPEGLGESLYVRVSPQSCIDIGLEMDADTVLWWMSQSDEARRELLRPAVDILSALDLLTAFVRAGGQDVLVWGNGAAADNAWTASAYRAARRKMPWGHWNDRCYRTIKNLWPLVPMERAGTHHNGLDDAKAQALHLLKIRAAEAAEKAAAAVRADELTLCLERCRATLEHNEERSPGVARAQARESCSLAIRTLAKHRGCLEDGAYWDRVAQFVAPAAVEVKP